MDRTMSYTEWKSQLSIPTYFVGLFHKPFMESEQRMVGINAQNLFDLNGYQHWDYTTKWQKLWKNSISKKTLLF